jgi:hypothetical protein
VSSTVTGLSANAGDTFKMAADTVSAPATIIHDVRGKNCTLMQLPPLGPRG